MMGAVSLSDVAQFFNLAEHVRPWLPWTWRVYATTWLIWSAILFLASILSLILHFALKPKPVVDWSFLRDARPFSAAIGTDSNGQINRFIINGLQLSGENVSGHTLHQVAGKITLADKRELPLFIAADREWVRTDQIEPISRFARLTLGGPFQIDPPARWDPFPQHLTPEQFVQAFGGSTVSVTIDGREESWSFSVEDLQQAIDKFRRETEDGALRMLKPEVHRKKAP